jgi:hypothetical protein
MRKLLQFSVFFACFPALYAQMTISAITVANIGHASVHIEYTTSAASWCQVRYGLSSGVYTYTGGSGPSTTPYGGSNQVCEIAIGGLTPGTPYFLQPTARPNINDATGICNTGGCGAAEQTFTTSAAPTVHPAPPTAPTSWVPTHPDTSAYTVISMVVSGGTGECVAASSIAQQPTWVAPVTAGDNITTILAAIGFATVIEFPQGASCKVLQTETGFHTGYALPAYPVDPTASSINDPAHRWVVFRTIQSATTDFPAFGVRTGPAWASKMAKLIAQTPGQPQSPGSGTQNFNGQLFDCYQIACHHFWFENMEWTHLADSTIYTPGAVDPPAFVNFLRLASPQYAASLPANQMPEYNVVDRVYMHEQPYPARLIGDLVPGGNHWAVLSSYLTANMWVQGAYPQVNPTMLGAVITVPQSTYKFNAISDPAIGMTGTASITFSGASLGSYTGVFYAWLDSGGLTLDYQTASGVTASCTGCTLTSEATPARTSVPATSMYFFNGHFSGGTAILDQSTPSNVNPSLFSAFTPRAIYEFPGNFGYVDNNYMSAIGQTYYNDTDGSHADHVWTRNYLDFPRTKMANSGTWDGLGYSFRNVFETKQATRWNISGNIFDGSAAYQNPGNVMYIAGSYAGTFSTGTQDIAIRNNVFKHLSSGFQCAGGGAQQFPDSPTAERIAISNNLWLDLNRDLYNNGGGGLFSGPFSMYPDCIDVSIDHNIIGFTKGGGPSILTLGGASNYATTVVGEGIAYRNNQIMTSLGGLDVIISIDGGQAFSAFPANPLIPASNTTTWQGYLDGNMLRAGASIVPNWIVRANEIVGTQTNRGGTWIDQTQTDVNGIASAWPEATSTFPAGSTMSARLVSAGFSSTLNTSSGNPGLYRSVATSYNAGDRTANIDAVYAAAGIVSGISLTAGATSAQLRYVAPDSRACAVDVSPNGTTWTRTTDAAGARPRTLAITSLTASTAYQYRLMCYFDQTTAAEFASDEITTGTFTTTAAASRTVTQGFVLPTGATQILVTYTPFSGSAVTQTCTTSPCSLTVTSGAYTVTMQPQTGGAVSVGPVNTFTAQVK